MLKMSIEIYKEIALSQVPRCLGLGDRNPDSKTYGCFDRYYWHYKLIDFPNARFQEVALLLALLYKHEFPENIYFGKKKVFEWIRAAIQFWAKIQNGDGSFNEAYPFERGFCCTAFSTYAITETLLLLDKKWELGAVKKAGEWLLKNNNLEVSNQMASAALALYNVYLLTSDEKFLKGYKEKVSLLLKNQSPDGFYLEYDGYDIGYDSITLGILSRLHKKTKDKKLLDSMRQCLKFLESKIKDNGSFDYSKTSRKTQFLYPFGFAYLKSPILNKIEKGLIKNEILNPKWFDDRYVIQITTDYLETYLEMKNVDGY